MPSVDFLMLDETDLTGLVARLSDLDPGGRYEVTIRRVRSRAEIAADLAKLSDVVSSRARESGMTVGDLAVLLEADTAEIKNLLG